MLQHIDRPLECSRLVLQPDLDQLKGRHDKALGSARCAAGEDGDGLCGLALAIVGDQAGPVAVCTDCLLVQRHVLGIKHVDCVGRRTLDSTLGRLHEQGRYYAFVQPRRAARQPVPPTSRSK